ncbi:hypothetical protein D9M70_570420 [compost metagenome]
MNTRLGDWMPRVSVNQPLIDEPIPTTASRALPRADVMPFTKPLINIPPNSLNLPGSSVPK